MGVNHFVYYTKRDKQLLKVSIDNIFQNVIIYINNNKKYNKNHT